MSVIMEYGLWESSKSFPHNFHIIPTSFPQEKVELNTFISRFLGNFVEFSTFPWPLDFSF
jgi:hypothetical protein